MENECEDKQLCSSFSMTADKTKLFWTYSKYSTLSVK